MKLSLGSGRFRKVPHTFQLPNLGLLEAEAYTVQAASDLPSIHDTIFNLASDKSNYDLMIKLEY